MKKNTVTLENSYPYLAGLCAAYVVLLIPRIIAQGSLFSTGDLWLPIAFMTLSWGIQPLSRGRSAVASFIGLSALIGPLPSYLRQFRLLAEGTLPPVFALIWSGLWALMAGTMIIVALLVRSNSKKANLGSPQY